MPEFRPNQPANEAHLALQSSLRAMEKAHQCAVLWFGEILDRRLYRELGYSSINQYAKVALGFSTSRTGDFLQLCRKLKKLPKVKEQVARGRLGYTAARVLVTVADPSNEAAWVDVALGSSRRELERQVKRAKQEASKAGRGQGSLLPVAITHPAAVVPVRVSVEMSPTQLARYEAIWEQLRKQGGLPADRAEALLAIMAGFAAQGSPRGDVAPAAQVHIHQCPACEKATVQTTMGERELSAAEWAQVQCDCRVSEPGRRNTTAIPPATRRRVLARDRHRCQQPGCGHVHFLEVHHKTPRSRGGGNDPENLTTLCSACHRLLHETGLSWVGSPRPVYRWPAALGDRQ